VSADAIVTIVVGLIAALAALSIFTSHATARRDHGTGTLARETKQRDETHARARHRRSERLGEDRTPVTVGALHPVPAADNQPAVFVPPDAERVGVTRRQFFNRSAITLLAVGAAGFGGSVLAFLWPKIGAGFGAKIPVGQLDDLVDQIQQNDGALYLSEALAWLVQYPPDALPKAMKAYSGPVLTGMENGIVALYQKCVHLGCRVPFCESSQWFECPCHGSQYNRVGEKKGGPAPRGLDRFAVQIGTQVIIDTSDIVLGPPIGTNTTGQEAEGPHCITTSGG
jgi:cytochrome b6-f complex iron-sulfur subunit